MIRVIIPDTHGSEIDPDWRAAFLKDLTDLDASEIVMLGDHIDVSGLFSSFAPKGIDDLEYAYSKDVRETNRFLDCVQRRAPKASIYYIEGNHEQRAERWAVNLPGLRSKIDARSILEALAPYSVLGLHSRGIRYYRQTVRYQGLAACNTIKLGKCYFTHGYKSNKHAAASHVEACAGNVVHGHTHRAQSYVIRTIKNEAIAGHCPGTGAKLQPTYMHTGHTLWTHGYALQFVQPRSGSFLHVQVPIVKGRSMLRNLLCQGV